MSLADWQLIGCLVAYAVVLRFLFFRLIACVRAGQAGAAVLCVWLTSPVMLALIAKFGENRSLGDFTHWGDMPWSLIFGDTIVLPLAAYVAAKSAPDWYDQPLVTSRRWTYACLAIGLAAGISFHLYDSANYVQMGVGALTVSISKIYHDLVIYPVLFGSLLCVGVPALRYGSRAIRFVLIGCLVAWLLLVVRDMYAGLDPRGFHTACDVACGSRNIGDHIHDLLGHLRGVLRASRIFG